MTTSPANLLEQHCQPLKGIDPMAPAQVEAQLAQSRQTAGWALANGALERAFEFNNYHETMAFVNALAWVAHRQDHHPELTVTYGRCVVRFNTHSVGGISINDFISAAKANALFN